MLDVVVRYIPLGDGQPQDIARLEIVNTGEHAGRPDFGSYRVRAVDQDGSTCARSTVQEHRRSDGIWPLLAAATERVRAELFPQQTIEDELTGLLTRATTEHMRNLARTPGEPYSNDALMALVKLGRGMERR